MAAFLSKESETSISLQTRPRAAGSSECRGRPRKYGLQDFRSVRDILDKHIRLKASVFTQWNIVKNTSTETRTIPHSNFAYILLNHYQRAEEGKVGKGSTILRKQWVATDIIFLTSALYKL